MYYSGPMTIDMIIKSRTYNIVEEKSIMRKENVCFEEARRESIKENEKKVADMSQDVCIRTSY